MHYTSCRPLQSLLLVLFFLLTTFFRSSKATLTQHLNHQLWRRLRQNRINCLSSTLNCHLHSSYDFENCIYLCMSPQCYQLVYASEPLEEGQVDHAKSRRFMTCAHNEQLILHRKNRAILSNPSNTLASPQHISSSDHHNDL